MTLIEATNYFLMYETEFVYIDYFKESAESDVAQLDMAMEKYDALMKVLDSITVNDFIKTENGYILRNIIGLDLLTVPVGERPSFNIKFKILKLPCLKSDNPLEDLKLFCFEHRRELIHELIHFVDDSKNRIHKY